MNETYYGKLQQYFGQENLEVRYMHCDSFVLSIETQNRINDLKKLEDLFDFNILNESHQLFSNKINKNVGKLNIETPEKNWMDEFVCLKSKSSSFKCGNKNTNKLNGISEFFSKNKNFEEYKKCLDGVDYQKECDH